MNSSTNTPFLFINTTAPDRKLLQTGTSQVILALRFTAAVFSVLNISVLAHPRLKDPLYKFLLVMSIADCLYSGSLFFLGMFAKYCYAHSVSATGYFIFLLLYIIISEYLTSSLAFFNIILELFLTGQRIVIISNNVDSCLKTAKFKHVFALLASVSLAVYAPTLFMNSISAAMVEDTSKNLVYLDYRLVKTEFSLTKTAAAYVTTMNIARMVLVTCVLFILNIIASIKFRAFLKKKFHLKEMSSKFNFV
jgi:hypothetical protein